MESILAATPYWLWLLGVALLGAATVWVYLRCQIAENRALYLDVDDAAETDGLAMALGETLVAEPAAPPAAPPNRQEAERSYLDWAASHGVSDADGRIEPADRGLALRAAQAEDRLRRALAAAKLGRLNDLAEIEDEATDAHDALADLTSSAAAIDALSGDADEDLRVRNWLLASRLYNLLNALREGRDVDPERAESELRSALLSAFDPQAAPPDAAPATAGDLGPIAVVAREAAPLASPDGDDAAIRRNRALSRQLGEVAAALRLGRSIDPDEIETAVAEIQSEEPAALDAPTPHADEERVEALVEAAKARAELGAAEGRAWVAEWRLRELQNAAERNAVERAASDGESRSGDDDRVNAAFAEVASLTQRLSAAEAALREMRERAGDAEALNRQLDAAAAEIERLRLAQAFDSDAPQAAAADPELELELHQLRKQVASLSEASADAEALRRTIAERDNDYTRLERELARLEAAPRTATVAQESPPAGVETDAPDPPSPRHADPTAIPETSAEARKLMREVFDTPLTDIEIEAQELIRSGAIVAIFSNRPASLLDESEGRPADDLTMIIDISPKLASLMNGFGLFYFRQLADFGPAELAWVDDRLAMRGAVVSQRWAPQAERLAAMQDRQAATLHVEGVLEPVLELTDELASEPNAAPVVAEAPALEALVSVELAAPDGFREETADLLPRHHASVEITSPMTGAEAAAMEILERPDFKADLEAPPPGVAALREEVASDDRAETRDDFRVVRGVGPRLDAWLHALGLRRIDQLATLAPADLAWIDRVLGLDGRSIRERWLAQARQLSERRRERQRDAAREAADRGDSPPRETAAQRQQRQDDLDRPTNTLEGPSNGAPDDLKLLSGVDAPGELRLNGLGFYYFSQIARLSDVELAWIDRELALDGRTSQTNWRAAARGLAERKAKGALHIGADGSWTGSIEESDLSRIVEEAKTTPYSEAEVEAMRMINAGYRADDELRPGALLFGPDKRPPDDLQKILGVSSKIERRFNSLGLYYFEQLAGLSAADIAWIDARLQFNGRIVRERWIAQASELDKRSAPQRSASETPAAAQWRSATDQS